MPLPKPRLSFAQIINMNVGFLGIQYSFGLQQNAVNPIYDFLGANPDEIPLLNLAGPVTGLVIQPIIGALSDKTWHPRWGRRKPYFLIGAMLCSIGLFIYPFSSSLWMAAGMLWILDAANNTAMEPYRAFIADKLPAKQHPEGFLTQSFFTGLGITLASVSLYFFAKIFKGNWGALPTWVYASFFFGAFCSIASVWWSVSKTPEIPPDEEEIKAIRAHNAGNPHPVVQLFASIIILFSAPLLLRWLLNSFIQSDVLNFLTLPIFFVWVLLLYKLLNSFAHIKAVASVKSAISPFLEIVSAIKDMPRVMWQLALVYLFQWYALFCYWQNAAKSVGLSVWKTTPANKELYGEAVGWTGLVNGWYNIVTFLSAFLLVWLVKQIGAKWVHIACLILAGAGLLIFPHIENKYLLFAPMTGFGIAWASMMGVPYLLVVNNIPKERYGVYMGIINMMIVIPMIIQNLTFGPVLKNILHNDAGKAVAFAGVLLLIAAAATLLIKPAKAVEGEDLVLPAGGGH
jgi:maltose/moltooligosaccharide transporter